NALFENRELGLAACVDWARFRSLHARNCYAQFVYGKLFMVALKDAVDNPRAIKNPDVKSMGLPQSIFRLGSGLVPNKLARYKDAFGVGSFLPHVLRTLLLELRPPLLLRAESECPALRGRRGADSNVPGVGQGLGNRVGLRV